MLHYFGFHEDPFGVTPDPRYLYPSQTHQEALASIQYGFQSNRGFTAMIAPPGMGKTTLLRCFLEKVRDTTCSVFLFNVDPACEPKDFVGYILREIGITPGSSSSEMHEQLSDALVKETRLGRKFVVVIDEAQNLSDAVLERVRLLTNFETSRGKLMHVVLSGQPQLSEKLLQPALLQLRQRVSIVCRLDPLSERDAEAYINCRLKQAGYKGESLFTKEAVTRIAEASQGIPRTINNLCFNALSLCCALRSRQVTSSMVAEVISDLSLKSRAMEPPPAVEQSGTGQPEVSEPIRTMRKFVAAPALLLICVIGLLGVAGFRYFQAQKSRYDRSSGQNGPPAPARVPFAATMGQLSAKSQSQVEKTFMVTVEQNQTLRDISIEYLGAYDLLRLQQIHSLNPRLINPDHIEVGQKLLLPRQSPTPVVGNVTLQGSEREVP